MESGDALSSVVFEVPQSADTTTLSSDSNTNSGTLPCISSSAFCVSSYGYPQSTRVSGTMLPGTCYGPSSLNVTRIPPEMSNCYCPSVVSVIGSVPTQGTALVSAPASTTALGAPKGGSTFSAPESMTSLNAVFSSGGVHGSMASSGTSGLPLSSGSTAEANDPISSQALSVTSSIPGHTVGSVVGAVFSSTSENALPSSYLNSGSSRLISGSGSEGGTGTMGAGDLGMTGATGVALPCVSSSTGCGTQGLVVSNLNASGGNVTAASAVYNSNCPGVVSGSAVSPSSIETVAYHQALSQNASMGFSSRGHALYVLPNTLQGGPGSTGAGGYGGGADPGVSGAYDVKKCHLHSKPQLTCKFCRKYKSAVHQQARLARQQEVRRSDYEELDTTPDWAVVEMTNTTTYNVNNLLRENILASEYFKSLYSLHTFDEIVEEIFNYADHAEPYCAGSSRAPSTLFCCLYKLFTMRLREHEVHALLDHSDSPYLRCAGLLYLRYVLPPDKLWDWFSPYFLDDEVFSAGVDKSRTTTIGEYAESLITEDRYFTTVLPRIPVKIKAHDGAQLMTLGSHRKRKMHNKEHLDQFKPGVPVAACFEREWIEGKVLSIETSDTGQSACLVQFDDDVLDLVDLGLVIILDAKIRAQKRREERRVKWAARGLPPPVKRKKTSNKTVEQKLSGAPESPVPHARENSLATSGRSISSVSPSRRHYKAREKDASSPSSTQNLRQHPKTATRSSGREDLPSHPSSLSVSTASSRRPADPPETKRRPRLSGDGELARTHDDRTSPRRRSRSGSWTDSPGGYRRRNRSLSGKRGDHGRPLRRSRSRDRPYHRTERTDRSERPDRGERVDGGDRMERKPSPHAWSSGDTSTQHTQPKTQHDVMEEFRRRERAKALASGKDYARRPTSYKSSLSLRFEMSTGRKRSRSPPVPTIHCAPTRTHGQNMPSAALSGTAHYRHHPSGPDSSSTPQPPQTRPSHSSDKKEPSLAHQQRMAQLIERYSKPSSTTS